MLQFERAKENIKGHGVMITSWYDADASTWRASAPGHLHLLRNARPVVITGDLASRRSSACRKRCARPS